MITSRRRAIVQTHRCASQDRVNPRASRFASRWRCRPQLHLQTNRGVRSSTTERSSCGRVRRTRRGRRGHRERAAIGYQVGSDLPCRRIVANRIRCGRDNDRANPAQVCLQRLLSPSAGRHRIPDGDCAQRNKLLPQRPPAEKSGHGLGFARQAAFNPAELRSVERRHLHHRDLHVAVVVKEFAPKRIAKTLDGVLGCAIGGLQRNAAIRQRAANLHDNSAIAGEHPFQRSERAVNVTEVSHFSHASEFLSVICLIGEKTDVIALLIQISM